YYSQISPLILLRYYDDATWVLRKMCLDAKAPHLSSTLPPTLLWKFNKPVHPNKRLTRQGNGHSEELRCVIAVIRHGDRTPKQKVKLNVTEEKLLNLMLKYNGGKPRAEMREAPAFLPGRESNSDPEDLEHAEKFRQVKAVLEESFSHSREPFGKAQGENFSGIYMKVQLKPLKWDGEGEEKRPVEALMILKYGGVLTHVTLAEELGRFFRYNMYPGKGTGLLRLHSTYRRDLKIYNSNVGRMSAAAFAKGLLDLEGQLTPILVSLVSKDSSMLDGLDTVSIEMEAFKARLNEIVKSGKKMINELLLFIIIKS
ncbi:hypothetical protein IGI04_007580, partial [Brassica rapa subsp. trilocularis]